MTIHEAHRLNENWKTKYGETICAHTNLVDPLVSKNGQEIGFNVCMECGEIYAEHRNPLSSSEIKILKLLNVEDD